MARRCNIFKILKFTLLLLLIMKGYVNGLIVVPAVNISTLRLYSEGDLPYAVAIVKREGDLLNLTCQLTGINRRSTFIWNFTPSQKHFQRITHFDDDSQSTMMSNFLKMNLRNIDSGVYVCSIPPLSTRKQVLIQPRTPGCARGGFTCGGLCVLAAFLCDGYKDCAQGEDEASSLCGETPPCRGPQSLNCTSGRCIPRAACCIDRRECRPHPCCKEHPKYIVGQNIFNMEYPAMFDNDNSLDLGFMSTSITIGVCGLVFVLAVVVVVGAFFRMHLKRAQAYVPPAPQVYQQPVCARHVLLNDRSDFNFDPSLEDVQPYRSIPLRDDINPRIYAQRPLSLQVGRFQLNLPGIARRAGQRPDTPNVVAFEMDTISRTYQGENGHSILLGNMDDVGNDIGLAPPTYEEAIATSGGPPPEYLSRDDLNGNSTLNDLPPEYEDTPTIS